MVTKCDPALPSRSRSLVIEPPEPRESAMTWWRVCDVQLTVSVIEAQRLPAMNIAGGCDSYVKVFLLPAKKSSFTTKVQYNNINPQFHETFTFEVNLVVELFLYRVNYRLARETDRFPLLSRGSMLK